MKGFKPLDKDEHTNKNKNTNTNKNKNKHINKTHKRNITEDYDIPISGNKLSRITSSSITFPALTVGQIIMRIRDLVIDPLRKELAVYKVKL